EPGRADPGDGAPAADHAELGAVIATFGNACLESIGKFGCLEAGGQALPNPDDILRVGAIDFQLRSVAAVIAKSQDRARFKELAAYKANCTGINQLLEQKPEISNPRDDHPAKQEVPSRLRGMGGNIAVEEA